MRIAYFASTNTVTETLSTLRDIVFVGILLHIFVRIFMPNFQTPISLFLTLFLCAWGLQKKPQAAAVKTVGMQKNWLRAAENVQQRSVVFMQILLFGRKKTTQQKKFSHKEFQTPIFFREYTFFLQLWSKSLQLVPS